jgi:hypothetical protein
MRLYEVFVAKPVLDEVVKLKIAPKLAYRLLKYAKRVLAEWEVVEQQRVALIYEISKTPAGSSASIEPNTPEAAEYSKRFNEVLIVESELAPSDITMSELLDALGESEDNKVSVSELATIEPLFADTQ